MLFLHSAQRCILTTMMFLILKTFNTRILDFTTSWFTTIWLKKIKFGITHLIITVYIHTVSTLVLEMCYFCNNNNNNDNNTNNNKKSKCSKDPVTIPTGLHSHPSYKINHDEHLELLHATLQQNEWASSSFLLTMCPWVNIKVIQIATKLLSLVVFSIKLCLKQISSQVFWHRMMLNIFIKSCQKSSLPWILLGQNKFSACLTLCRVQHGHSFTSCRAGLVKLRTLHEQTGSLAQLL